MLTSTRTKNEVEIAAILANFCCNDFAALSLPLSSLSSGPVGEENIPETSWRPAPRYAASTHVTGAALAHPTAAEILLRLPALFNSSCVSCNSPAISRYFSLKSASSAVSSSCVSR